MEDLEAESRQGPLYWQDGSHCALSKSGLVGFGGQRELEGFKSERKVRRQAETVSGLNCFRKLWGGQRER